MNTSGGSVVGRRKAREMDETQLFFSSESAINSTNSKKKVKNKKKTESRNRANRCTLLTFQELPEYMKDNEYILNYYRANWPLKEALFSLFRWHNETLNIWTHLIGFVLFLGLMAVNLVYLPQVTDLFNIFTRPFPMRLHTNVSHNAKDLFVGTAKLMELKHTSPLGVEVTPPPEMAAARWPFYVFLGGSMFCLLSSSICHLFCCHSHHLNLFLLRMDYVGIAVMIITSFFPPISYIFQCQPHWQFIYLACITTMGIFTIITLLTPSLSSAKFRPFRALLFVAMGLFGIIPAVHALVVNWHEPQRNISLAYESAMALFYLTGTVFYVTRVPERWKPGWFDLAGHSHQIFHVFVILGALAHYGAALIFLDHRNKVGCETRL